MLVKQLLGAVCALTIVCASFSVVSAETTPALVGRAAVVPAADVCLP